MATGPVTGRGVAAGPDSEVRVAKGLGVATESVTGVIMASNAAQ